MCCFAQPVVHVEKTKIFARLTGTGTQHLVYEMKYESRVPNAMILPIPTAPNPTEDSVRFKDLSGYKEFFKDLKRAFPVPRPPKSILSRTLDSAMPMPQANLLVQEVGEFVASVVPTLKDFGRLDAQFVIPPETWQKIPLYEDYSFVVFQLKSLSGRPHPMAFEFDTRLPEEIFFPTVHIHDGEVHRRESFDHALYCQHAAYDGKVGKYKASPDRATSLQRSKSEAKHYVEVEKTQGIVASDLLVHRKVMDGTFRNEDIVLSAAGDPLQLSQAVQNPGRFNGLATMSAAALAVAAPVAWVINRRMTRQGERSE